MLLSILLSFLLARRFSEKTYVTLITVTAVLVSFFSAFGWITTHQHTDFTFKTVEYYKLHPVPLSFPFYASAFIELPVWPLPFDLSRVTYQIDFLTVEIISVTMDYSSFTVGRASVYYSFFLLVNIAGAIMGYWISKTAFMKRFFKTERASKVG